MSSYASDEEQLEALKSWWSENGITLLTGIALVLAVFFGMRQWQASTQSEAGTASDLYQQIADLSLGSITQQVSEESLADARIFYALLKSEHPKSIYTRFAALSMAKFLVENNQEQEAVSELQWALDNPDLGLFNEADPELYLIIRLRLARLKHAMGDSQAALALIQGLEPGSFTAGYSEVEGDILLSQGKIDEARVAYQKALAADTSGNPVILQLKLQELGVSPVFQ